MSLAAVAETTSGLVPLASQDAPSFIERQFPVGRLSAEAYKERKAGPGQTLTALGSYWKGRKPLILVRAVVLGCLLPATKDASADLDIFLKLMAMDDAAFGRRFDGRAAEFARLFPDAAEQVATNRERVWRDDLSADELRRQLAVFMPREGELRPAAASPSLLEALGKFVGNRRASKPAVAAAEFASTFPEVADDLTEEVEVRWRWRIDISLGDRQAGIGRAFATLPYAERLKHVRRPEECDEGELLAPIWPTVNRHLGTYVSSLPALVEQLGVARFGRRPKVADTFCGAGSIPFEAARIGCDVYASDLNPIACMLTWGAFNIIGASPQKRAEIEAAQKQVAAAVDAEIRRLGIEHDTRGDRAKAYLYCLETRCPKTGWMVPMAPSWVISRTRNVGGEARARPRSQALLRRDSQRRVGRGDGGGRKRHGAREAPRASDEPRAVGGRDQDHPGRLPGRRGQQQKPPADVGEARLHAPPGRYLPGAAVLHPVDHSGVAGEGAAGDVFRRGDRGRHRARTEGRDDRARKPGALAR
jgi:putative DNA methylase